MHEGTVLGTFVELHFWRSIVAKLKCVFASAVVHHLLQFALDKIDRIGYIVHCAHLNLVLQSDQVNLCADSEYTSVHDVYAEILFGNIERLCIQ